MEKYGNEMNNIYLNTKEAKYLLLDSEYEEIKNKVKEFSHRALF